MENRISWCRRGPQTVIALTALVALLVAGTSWAVGPDANAKTHQERNYDARIQKMVGLKSAQPSAAQKAAELVLRKQVPELAVTYDKTSGVARNVRSHTGYVSGPNPNANPRALALQFARENRELLGLSNRDLAHFRVTDEVYSADSGATHLYLTQEFRGIPVYNAQLHFNINREGRILSVNNAFVPNLAETVNASGPILRPREVMVAVAEHLGLSLNEDPTELETGGGDQQTTRLSPAGLSQDDVVAKLYWLPVGPRETRLTWNLQVRTPDDRHWYDINVDALDGTVWTRFDWANSGSYRVYEEPVESPNHTTPLPPADARTLAVNPEDATASPSGWFTGGTMSGNNVTACPDTSPANNACDSNPQCSGTTCDFPINLSGEPSTYVPAAVANLFYWNNTIHDIQYQYGFDEAAGNFQEDNFGNGGIGGDSVNADAQDGSGTCNANFATPTDGGNPRMQMFICGNVSPARDGDLDNAVIVHEYGHGISIRQVGGPGNSSCLNNTQQAGEGWSDWWGLAYTHEPGDQGTDARGIGTYLFGQAADGPGIRDLPYSTDPAVNNWTYESISGASVPHGVGSRWAQAAWEVYWALVDQHGFEADLLNFDINDPNEAGNKRAMFYINEGLKNTACSPTFVDNRDGIIQAATDNFGGADVCLLWDAFAAFGLGTDAVSGGANSTNPTNGFSIPAACQCQPQPIADAGPDQTICLGDSTTVGTPAQPDNTYSWSPGGETTAQITVSPTVTTVFTVTATTAACGSAQDSATITVDDGTGTPGLSDDFEGDNSDWTVSGLWHEANNTACVSPPSTSGTAVFYYGQDATCNYDTGAANSGSLTSPPITGITATSTLTFQHWRVVESFAGDFDQTDVNILTSAGSTNVFALNSSNASSPGWNSSGAIDLSAFAGQTIQVEFVFNTGDGVANNFTGWLIDDVVVTGESQCTPTGCTVDADCDNGLFCDGAETCDVGTGVCQPGTAPNCDDGVACTDDSCNESTDSCDNVANDGNCDNGLFCDGSETCDAVNDCQAGTAPDCDDGVGCTADSCNESTDSCDNTPDDGVCDNGLFCDGSETCDPVNDCQAGTPVDCNDGVGCTVDSCNEGTDSCDNAPNDAACDNGLFCDGSETCDPVNDCQAGSDPCPGQACDEGTDSCVACLVDADCDNGLFCDGAEACVGGVCQAGTPVDCDDGVGCTVDACNEGTDSCDNTPDSSACDNGLFCDGQEVCDPVLDCQSGADPCQAGETCNETDDVCEGAGAPVIWMSFRSNTAVPGVGTVTDEDVVSFDEGSGVWNLEFDGSDVGLGSFEIDGLAILPSGDLLLSFRQSGTIGGLSVDDSDIVQFTPTSLGSTTAGTFSLFFDGSDVGLTSNGEDVDAITLAADGRLIVSTQGGFSGTGASGADEDLFIFTGTLGPNTSGSFAQHFDGSDVALNNNSGEDVDAASLTQSGDLLFSTLGTFSVSGLSGEDEDIAQFSGTFGSSTSGSFTMRQDLSALGIDPSEDVGSVHVVE